MKAFKKIAIVGVVIALLVYACSPSNYSEKSALLKLEKALGHKVNVTHISALGYAVEVGDTYTLYFKVKCAPAEIKRLANLMNLEINYRDFSVAGGSMPDWLRLPDSPIDVYGLTGFSKADEGSAIQMWHKDGYLYVKMSFWH